jgi:hypothetical protein
VTQDVDPVSRGSDALRKHTLAEQRINEAGFAGVELAGHDQKKEPTELLSGLVKPAQVIRRNIGPKTLERGGEALEQLLLPDADILLAFRQDTAPGQQLSDHLSAK